MTPLSAYAIAFGGVSVLALAAASVLPLLSARQRAAAAGMSAAALAAVALLGGRGWVGAVVVDLALLAGGAAIGATIGARVPAPGHLLPVAWVSAFADLGSVLHPAGPTATMLRHERALSLVALSFPLLGTGEIVPVLGVGDVAFCALYVAAARRHDLGLGRVLLALAAGLLATLGLVVALERALPALPLLGAAVVASVPEARRIPPADRRSSVAAMAAVSAVVGLLLLGP